MENTISLETKYQNLATEYSKLRANATVLKKAVLEEQGRSKELKDTVKEQEQRLRKTSQEMESLTFRNQQLTKRISVLQEELNTKNNIKRTKGKAVENNTTVSANITLLDEELQKKIMDNARLISAMADKDYELSNLQQRINELEEKLKEEEKHKSEMESEYQEKIQLLNNSHAVQLNVLEEKLAKMKNETVKENGDVCSDKESTESIKSDENQVTQKQRMLQLEQDKERWKSEYELLLMNSDTSLSEENETQKIKEENIKEYFYKKINDLVTEKQEVESMSNSFIAECNALQLRLELRLEEERKLKDKITSSLEDITKLQEEFSTTSRNYETQLSAMSDHLADLNDKYTDQCEIIQQLHYQLGIKSKKK